MMSRLKDLRIFLIGLLLSVGACEGLKPDTIDLTSYPEVDQLLSNQHSLLSDQQLSKEVWLDGESETRLLQLDSAGWAEELAFLQEVNPNQSGYVGAFDESTKDNELVLKLKMDENGSLRNFSFTKESGNVLIAATIHEDKDVYVHHKEIQINLFDRKILDYEIEGYQKILLGDTIRFRISGSIE